MICFYHSADLDGHCSGAIVKRKYPDCEMIGIDYGDPFPWGRVKDQDVIMVDFSLQPFPEKMQKLNETAKSLIWIDHHKSEIDAAHKSGFLATGGQSLELDYAGCEQTWAWFYPKLATPTGVYLLGRYDIWQLSENPDIMPFQWGMRQYLNTSPENLMFWQMIFDDEVGFIIKTVETGKLLLKFRDSQNAKIMKATAFETRFEWRLFIASNIPLCNSQAFDTVYDPEKHDGMISFYYKPKAKAYTVSLYTTKDIDLSLIAKKHGGGGHKQACGFQCKVLPFRLDGMG